MSKSELPIDVSGIVKEYLIQNNYDGLCFLEEGAECGCGIDDFFCADECPNSGCMPAYLNECETCGISDQAICSAESESDRCYALSKMERNK